MPELDVPQGMTNPWQFIQKRIIFEYKIRLTDSYNKFERIYAQGKSNDNILYTMIGYLRQLYREIKGPVKKNIRIREELQDSIDYLEKLIADPNFKVREEDFPEIAKHYNAILDMLCYIKLTDIEVKSDDPGEAVMCSDSS